jgi:hypothetical protein
MKQVLGVSAFGLKDRVVRPGTGRHALGLSLADVVLPRNPLGRIHPGSEAVDERTHAGLCWPPEARIKPGEPLRRVPIPYVWRALVEARDRSVRWSAGQGVSFPLPRILAEYVAGLIADSTPNRMLSQHNTALPNSRDILPVVAIPDNLDEFGQEALLRELGRAGMSEAMLVWRPVAAALSWLDKVGGDFIPRHMGENDHIHVIYLGSDALEFTTFRLRVKEHHNQRYVLPLRNRPKELPQLTGMDWVGKLIEKDYRGIEVGAFWQAFINFPEMWRAAAGRVWNLEELPRAWSHEQGWTLWNPSQELYNQIYDVEADSCDTLRKILRGSCQLHASSGPSEETVGNGLRRYVRHMSELLPGGKLRGMIVCGPLAPPEIPSWLIAELGALSARGLEVEGELTEPEVDRLWLCTGSNDPVAEGAAIYGQRRLAEIPSYLDTMPQVSILAQGKGQYTWVPLLNAQEVLGGDEFRDTIRGRFQLDQGRRELHVYLCKGPSENASMELEEPIEAQDIPFPGITPCQARLEREIVRKLGSVEAVRQQSFLHDTTDAERYRLAFAKALFTGENSENDKPPEPSTAEMTSPFRRAIFDFPSAPTQDVVLDVEVRMRPASGLARVELVPKDASFLQGRRVRLNYSTMRAVARLPRRQRGWPRIQELVVDPNDEALKEESALVGKFEDTFPTDGNYEGIIDGICDRVLKKTALKLIADLQLWVHTIDQDGQACTRAGNDIIQRIAAKFESDFRNLKSSLKDKVFSRAAWLYSSTPDNITAYIREILTGKFTRRWSSAAEAASRVFVREEDFRTLFQAIARRADSSSDGVASFPIQAPRAICRVLMFRKDGEKGLDRYMAQLFANRALERMEQQQRAQKFSTLYFQLVRLLLYLLRYRRTDPACFDPNVPESIAVFDKAMESMIVAKRKNFRRARQLQDLIDGINNYLYYEGTEDVLTVLEDLAGDMD